MRLTQLSVFHPVIVTTIAMTMVIFGIFAFFNLGLEQNPQLTVPIMTVTASYPGASAEAVEQDVTRPIEDAVVGVGNVKTMTSTSQTSLSTLTVEFQEGVNIDVAASDRIAGLVWCHGLGFRRLAASGTPDLLHRREFSKRRRGTSRHQDGRRDASGIQRLKRLGNITHFVGR